MKLYTVLKQILITGTICLFSCSFAYAAEFGQATTTGVNIRAGAGLDTEVLGQIDKGTEYDVIERHGDWYEIDYDGQTAYVFSDYFELLDANGEVNGSNVNVRAAATTEATSLGKVSTGEKLTVTAQNRDWFQINYNGEVGYISKDFVTGENLGNVAWIDNYNEALDNVYGVITSSSGLKFRKEASLISIVQEVLPYGTEVDIDRIGEEWVRIITDDGRIGYVSAEYIDIREGERSGSMAVSSNSNSVVAYAEQFIGTPYVWGGTNLNSGVDCSGFVYSVYKNFGVSLNRSSYDMVNNGVEVPYGQLAAGDLVFFNSGGSSGISHVGLYMGDGNYIHATDGGPMSVTITSLSSPYSAKTYVTARRVM
ncbi:SH3 domain-containing protein [Chakrabartyella piscis]|uniref:C40 family peptidase n=1 Tax=Chakrabartyella piscis TaxID=2918914 RepID=UPI002958DA37|nr:SH3 domain-containing protein [Chakrabartyella piscis]